MNCQNLFSGGGGKRENIISLSSAELAQRVVNINILYSNLQSCAYIEHFSFVENVQTERLIHP